MAANFAFHFLLCVLYVSAVCECLRILRLLVLRFRFSKKHVIKERKTRPSIAAGNARERIQNQQSHNFKASSGLEDKLTEIFRRIYIFFQKRLSSLVTDNRVTDGHARHDETFFSSHYLSKHDDKNATS